MVLNLHLHTMLNVALRLGMLSLNVIKHHCFPSEKHHLTPIGFVE